MPKMVSELTKNAKNIGRNIFTFLLQFVLWEISSFLVSDRCGTALRRRNTWVVDKKHENLTEQHTRYLTSLNDNAGKCECRSAATARAHST